MNELQRQAWLARMGLTPWVAVRPLPGAAAAPLLEWPEQSAATRSRHAQGDASPAEPPVVAASPDARETLGRAARERRPAAASESARVEQQPGAPRAEARAAAGLRFTLQACPVGDIWLVAAQREPDLPDFTPPEMQLFRNLLRVFRARPGAMRKFEWPVGAVASDDAEAPVWFQGCLEMMAEKGGARVLVCAPERLARALLGVERYQPVEMAGARLLPVSSLDEMLAEPVEHKRRTWQAMVRAGFHA